MSQQDSADISALGSSARRRYSLLYAVAILLALMLVMSATAHLLSMQPAALIGLPIMLVGVTSLILTLLYLVGSEQQGEGGGPVAAVQHALLPAVAVDPQTGYIIVANEQAVQLVGREHVARGNHLSELFADQSNECSRILRDAVDCDDFELQACSVRKESGGAFVARLIVHLHQRDRSPFLVIGLICRDADNAVAEFARVQERLMSNISHELRTPLNVVMGFSELLTTETLGEMPANQIDAAEECHEGGERMLRLINDILDVGRSRSYYLADEVRPFSPVEMIHRVENLLSGQARREELRVEVALDENLPSIEVEERAFKQLVYHLILNSMKRSIPGDTIRIGARRDDDQLVISVTDAGGAVTERIQSQPIPPAAEVEAAETLAPSLVGLPLCATLAERLGASLSTETDEDGVHFLISLPLLRSH